MSITPLPNEAATICEFIGDRLYFTSLTQIPPQHSQQSDDTVYFTIDNTLHYVPFFSDFGPMNLAHVYKFCHILQNKLDAPSMQGKRICLYSSMESDKRANAAFLLCTYMLIVQGKTPDEAYKPLSGAVPAFVPYRDAGYGPATFYITILDCLRGLHKALIAGLVNMDEFNLEEYERYEKVENGDFNWLTNKFIAFASPQDETQQTFANRPVSLPPKAGQTFDSVLQYFKENGVTLVLRLNNKLYDKKKFLRAGIDHMEMYFPDGSCPSESILHKFLDVADRREGVIAVHCKAGLGRTGTLIGAWFMKEYKFTAAEIIAFLRVLRPGSVVGPQQNFLHSIQARLWKMDSQAGITRPPSRPVSRPQTPSSRAMAMDTDATSLVANSEARTGEYVIPAQPRKSPNERAAQIRNAPITVGSWKSAASPSSTPTFTAHSHQRERYNLRSNGPARLSVTGSSVPTGVQLSTNGGNYSTGVHDATHRTGSQMVPKQRTTATYGYLFGGLPGSPGSSSSLSSPTAPNASSWSKTKKAVAVGKAREHR